MGLRRLARGRNLRPLRWLVTVGLWPIGLSVGRTIHVWPIWFGTAGLRPNVRLGHRRTVGFRLVVRLRGSSNIVLRMRRRRIDRRLNRGTLDWRVIGRTSGFGCHDGAVAKCSGFRSSSNCRCAMIDRSSLLRVRTRGLRMFRLNGYRWNVFLTSHCFLLGRWAHADPAVATVVADPVHSGTVDHCCVVNVMDDGDVHVVYRTVVEKMSVIPTSALVAISVVTVAVTDATIETYLLAPIAVIENVSVAAPAPVRRSPEQPHFWSHDPGARNPVVVVVVVGVCPVPRRPEITIARTERLLVNR